MHGTTRAHCGKIGVHGGTYDRWFQRGLLLKDNDEWLFWLYGAQAPAGWLVVTDTMHRFRAASTHKSAANATGISLSLVALLRKKAATRKALQAAMERAGGTGKHSPAGLADVPEWNALNDATRKSMWRYAERTTLAKHCARTKGASAAGKRNRHLAKGVYLKWLRNARDIDSQREQGDGQSVLAALKRFLDPCRDLATGRDYQPAGIVVPGLFIPTSDMLRFREIAAKAMVRGKVWANLRPLPHFAEWMRDWTAPMPQRGQRSIERWSPEPDRVESNRQSQPAADSAPEKGSRPHKRRGRPREKRSHVKEIRSDQNGLGDTQDPRARKHTSRGTLLPRVPLFGQSGNSLEALSVQKNTLSRPPIFLHAQFWWFFQPFFAPRSFYSRHAGRFF